MLDLQRYKKRLEHGHYAQSYIAAEDVADLVAEVERLREAIARHRVEYLGGSIPARDRELWEVLHA